MVAILQYINDEFDEIISRRETFHGSRFQVDNIITRLEINHNKLTWKFRVINIESFDIDYFCFNDLLVGNCKDSLLFKKEIILSFASRSIMFLKYNVLWPRRWIETYSISSLSLYIERQLENIVMRGDDINGCTFSVDDDQATLIITDEILRWSFELINVTDPEPPIMVNGWRFNRIQIMLYQHWWVINVYIPQQEREEQEEQERQAAQDSLQDRDLECLHEMLDDSSIDLSDLSDVETVIVSDCD
ncbi:uncharacterized protein LOC123259292 [Cotesia glomerata]|uniref:uncharacterized protein LOC123259292 n=1 Tax=Cotesia glomerata TaxID=32391 RepID=UPI001D032A70|nr:uncharacterized protein LOC123259292 [Cotesia glomerata]